jgi:hypothetical protein
LSAIHLLERVDNVRKTDRSKNEWESGNWLVTEEVAQRLVGSTLYLHRSKLQPSHFGGEITGYRLVESGAEAGHVVFQVRARADCKGVKTDNKGWTNNQKIFWQTADSAQA